MAFDLGLRAGHALCDNNRVKPRVFLPAIATGPLLWAAFFPLDLGPLAAFALVPWLFLVRMENVSRGRRYFAAFLGGLAFALPALQWIRVAHPAMYASWLFLSCYVAAYFPAALFLLRRLDRLAPLSLSLTLPIVWVALEYVRAHFPTGFPFLKSIGAFQLSGFAWYFLGHPLHSIAPLRQAVDLGGVYVLSFLVAATNGAAHEWFARFKWVRSLLRLPQPYQPGYVKEMYAASWVAVLFLGLIGYGVQRVLHPPFDPGPRVTALQADIPQNTKMEDLDGLFTRYDRLCVPAARRADLVVWPETCFPYSWYARKTNDTPPAVFLENLGKRTQQLEEKAAGDWKTNVLLGLTTYEWDNGTEWRYNSAMLVRPDGGQADRYDKMHLVPFGEYVPFKETFPWLQAFTPYKGDYSCKPGESETRFDLPVGEDVYRFGVLICYEDSDPGIARRYVAPGSEPVHFLINMSNDGWFRGTEQHEQHLAICRFRAVETRRTVVRAVNMGISAIIDPDGKVVALPADNWQDSKRMDGTVTMRIPLDNRTTLYARYGDWLPATCWLVLTVGHFASKLRRRKP
jgi:apolipoprotein N-acyltransferase